MVTARQSNNPQQRQLYALALAEAERRKRASRATIDESDWRQWLAEVTPGYVSSGFAPRHVEFWDWVWSVNPDNRPAPFVAIWPRGGGKSTSAELAVVALGALQRRRYVLYVSGTQEQADKHVQTIAAVLESSHIERYYPALGERLLSKYGHSRGWTRQLLRTKSGFMVEAVGLDKNIRGIKRDDQRPDLIIIDDIDSIRDSAEQTAKKIDKLTKDVFQTGSGNVAVLAVQNLITSYGVFAQLLDGSAEFLADRVISGPYPALYNPEYTTEFDGNKVKYTITAGRADWQGQGLAECQHIVNTAGWAAFAIECQHDVRRGEHYIYANAFSADRNKCPRFTIPDSWARYCGVDFGGMNTAAVLLAEEPNTGRLFLYREYHAGDLSSADHAAAILKGEPMIPTTAGGARSEGQWRREFKLGGLPVKEPVIADVEVGISRVKQVIRDGLLVVFDDCRGVLGEIDTYRREVDEKGNPTQAIADKNRYHRLDALRYIVSRVRK